MRVIGACIGVIDTGSAHGALGRATFNPLVQGSTPWRPTWRSSRFSEAYFTFRADILACAVAWLGSLPCLVRFVFAGWLAVCPARFPGGLAPCAGRGSGG